ncbi:unnamed protein product [Parascedosporium putredinis]|uniref:Uncharacterized protein n=1 Tax=Parascedosporium putredinis TaxID=1442378 RepID=A0A9P1MC84_9PEZI|nr:unnamed protein product [Parascedosporium putredinis]CAI8001102.1 unnamed protein product [Parascedosporium putredinis]
MSEVLGTFRPTKLFHREDVKDGQPRPRVLSLDFDDPGELLMTAESDETIQIYNLAKFTHTSSSIIYASTKQNDAIRYLATHDNSFIRYFEGHEGRVTCLSMHPGHDNFISCSQDNTVRLWNISTKQWVGQLFLNTPYLAAYDPSGNIFAVASPTSGSVLLYDCKNFDKAPFSVFDVPLLLDAFDGSLKAYLRKPEGGTSRLAPGDLAATNGSSGGSGGATVESSGDCCFSPDGRYVVSGSKKGVLGWDTKQAGENKVLEPTFMLEDKREASVIAFNPRYNHFATADEDVIFWVPDPNA